MPLPCLRFRNTQCFERRTKREELGSLIPDHLPLAVDRVVGEVLRFSLPLDVLRPRWWVVVGAETRSRGGKAKPTVAAVVVSGVERVQLVARAKMEFVEPSFHFLELDLRLGSQTRLDFLDSPCDFLERCVVDTLFHLPFEGSHFLFHLDGVGREFTKPLVTPLFE